MIVIEPGFLQIDIPLVGPLFTIAIGFYLASLAVRLIVAFLKSLPFI